MPSPFKEKLSSQTLHLAPMENHHNVFKEDCSKWPRFENLDSHGKIRSQHKVYQCSNNSSQPVGRHKVSMLVRGPLLEEFLHVATWCPKGHPFVTYL
jgi:hypothetical protein